MAFTFFELRLRGDLLVDCPLQRRLHRLEVLLGLRAEVAERGGKVVGIGRGSSLLALQAGLTSARRSPEDVGASSCGNAMSHVTSKWRRAAVLSRPAAGPGPLLAQVLAPRTSDAAPTRWTWQVTPELGWLLLPAQRRAGPRALITGPTLRGLAARAPYFHNGSAARLEDVIGFYDARFQIGLTEQERADLLAFLAAL